MKYDFETAVNRRNIGNSKYERTPSQMKENGFLAYTGAEMDYKTAPCIRKALTDLAEGGIYGSTLIYKEYTDAVVRWMKTVRSWDVEAEWICQTYGTVHALGTAVRAFTNEGDGVIIQPPVYTPFSRICTDTNRVILENPLIYDNGSYSIDFEGLEKLMAREDAKVMLLCNPHNPITRVWPEEDLERIAQLAAEYGVVVVSDEIYGELDFAGHPARPFASVKGAKDISVVCTSIGKDFNFVGPRHANVIIPDEKLRKTFVRQLSYDQTGEIDPFMYVSVLAAYTDEGLEWLKQMKEYGCENTQIVHRFFEENLPQVKVSESQAGCLCWIDWRALGMNEDELQIFLEEECMIQCNKGSRYGVQGEGFTRMAVGTPRQGLIDALERVKAAAIRRGFIK